MQCNPELMKKYGISEDDLTLASAAEKESIDQMRPSVTYWKDAFARFRRNKLAIVMFFLLMCIILMAIFGPIISPYTYKGQSRDVRQGPSWEHWLGTDNLMMRFVDLMMTIPSMLIIILLSVVLRDPLESLFNNPTFSGLATIGSGLISIFLVLALFNWLGMARAVRASLLMNRSQEYVLASEAMGARSKWVLSKHLLPNSIGVIIISATGVVPGAIMTESFLSFIGLGVSAPMPSLGSMANTALNGIISYPQNMLYPAFLISMIILCFNILGDALRDALDPKMRK